jgi:predicted  nucleic acid-binding Zn-ribbon protein
MLLALKGRFQATQAALVEAHAALTEMTAAQAAVGEVAEALRSDVPSVAERVSPLELKGVDPWGPEAVGMTLRAAGEAIDALVGELDGLADNTGALEAQNDDLRNEQAELVARAMELQEAVRVATEDSTTLDALAGERDSAVAGMEIVKEVTGIYSIYRDTHTFPVC